VQRQRLLATAHELLRDPAGAELTLQRVARAAGVTPALAHYYFASADGLLDALLAERIGPRVDELADAARLRVAEPVAALTFLLQRTGALLAADPATRHSLMLPGPAARALRDRLRAVLRELLASAQARQLLRADLPPDYLAEALLGLALFPFLDRAQVPATDVAALTLQHVALLRTGILPAQRPRQESSA
jgi:AcrR family transcriptional regulator